MNIIEINNLSFCHKGKTEIEPVSVRLRPGDRVIIVGPSNTGKTITALRVVGLDEHAEKQQAGKPQIVINGADLYCMPHLRRAEITALVSTNPALLFSCLAPTVAKEMELSYALLGRRPDAEAIHQILLKLNCSNLAQRDPFSLSGGEKVLVGLALALVKKPKLLALDDVFGELSADSANLVHTVLKEERQNGLIILEFHSLAPKYREDPQASWLFILSDCIIQGSFEHCWQRVAGRAPSLLPATQRIAARIAGKLEHIYDVVPITLSAVAQPLMTIAALTETPNNNFSPQRNSKSLIIKNLQYLYPDNSAFCLGPISYEFKTGKTTAIIGRNGAGKTTLVKCIGNLLSASSEGEIIVHDKAMPQTLPLHLWAKDIVYSFQNPDDQLFLATVDEELSETARRTRGTAFPIQREVLRIAAALGLSEHLPSSPLNLPRPYQRMVTLGSALVAAPAAILFDEPTSGLDQSMIERVKNAIIEYNRNGGTSIIVSHNYDFVMDIADELLVLDEGKLTQTAPKETMADLLPEGSALIPDLVRLAGWPDTILTEEQLISAIFA